MSVKRGGGGSTPVRKLNIKLPLPFHTPPPQKNTYFDIDIYVLPEYIESKVMEVVLYTPGTKRRIIMM